MIRRILSSAVAAASVATAIPALAYDPSDPKGPSPDDPAAWRTVGAPAPATMGGDGRCSGMDDSVQGPASSRNAGRAKASDVERRDVDDSVDRG